LERADEALHDRSPNVRLPSLCLHVDDVKPESILLNDSIDPGVAGGADAQAGVLSAAAVADRVEYVEYEVLEGRGRHGGNPVPHLGDQRLALLRRSGPRDGGLRNGRSCSSPRLSCARFPELGELGELREDPEVHPVWVLSQHIPTARCDRIDRAARPREKSYAVEICRCPADTVVESLR
jgi:hypothetical protein